MSAWPSWGSGGESNLFLASSRFWWLLAFLVLCPHHSNFGLSGHKASSSSRGLILLCLSLMRTYVMIFKACLDNSRWSPHLKILHLITSAKTFFTPKCSSIYCFKGVECRHIFGGSHFQPTMYVLWEALYANLAGISIGKQMEKNHKAMHDPQLHGTTGKMLKYTYLMFIFL